MKLARAARLYSGQTEPRAEFLVAVVDAAAQLEQSRVEALSALAELPMFYDLFALIAVTYGPARRRFALSGQYSWTAGAHSVPDLLISFSIGENLRPDIPERHSDQRQAIYRQNAMVTLRIQSTDEDPIGRTLDVLRQYLPP